MYMNRFQSVQARRWHPNHEMRIVCMFPRLVVAPNWLVPQVRQVTIPTCNRPRRVMLVYLTGILFIPDSFWQPLRFRQDTIAQRGWFPLVTLERSIAQWRTTVTCVVLCVRVRSRANIQPWW
jgi:hypothetical protein